MSPGSSTESYPAFVRIGLRENPGKNLNQVTCPDRDSNPGHLVSQPDTLTVTPQIKKKRGEEVIGDENGLLEESKQDIKNGIRNETIREEMEVTQTIVEDIRTEQLACKAVENRV
ncbi:hypothetical protein ANN_08820 [Periplaneta americana]|uniref:Uncharacterized protein n=1 Tax=Periplaneta americana TaxID=6978 RepID=A0ABQ8T445_PERAM|nr:hypothetical protein ANN_08820 [Periplaneta americana]